MLSGRKLIPIPLLARLTLPQEYSYKILLWLLSRLVRIELHTASTSSYSLPSFRVNETDIYEHYEKHSFDYTVNSE